MMKPSGPTLLAGAFLGLVGVAGYILASGPEAGQAAPDGKMKPIELAAATVNGGAKPSAAPAPAPSASVAAPAVAAAAADERLVIKRILPIKGPIKYGEWHWDDTNVPAGPIVVTVDLEVNEIVSPSGRTFRFSVPELYRHAMLDALDPISATLRFRDDIVAYEKRDRGERSWAYFGSLTGDSGSAEEKNR